MIRSERAITRAVTTMCRAQFGAAITVVLAERMLPDDWGRNLVWRYHVQNATGGVPATVIAKVSKVGGGHIFNEWASLQFLNQFDALHDLVPAFYGGDADLELLLLEDLGPIRHRHDLGYILDGDDPALARAALLEHARQMALLHRTTADHEAAFNHIRSRLPAYDQPPAKDQFEAHFNWLSRTIPQFGIAPSPALEDDIRHIIARLRDPQGLRAYTRGDVCPSNVAYHHGQIRFYDFEMGAFRPVFLSVVYFALLHLSCFNGNLIPADLRAAAEHVYFAAMAPLITQVADHQVDIAAAAAAMLIWMLSMDLEKEDRPRHLATRHQRIYGALTLYTQNAAFMIAYPHLADVLLRLHHRLTSQWSEAEHRIDLFPAFQSGTW